MQVYHLLFAVMLSQLVLVLAIAGVQSLPTRTCIPNQWSAIFYGKVAMDYNGKPMVASIRYVLLLVDSNYSVQVSLWLEQRLKRNACDYNNI